MKIYKILLVIPLIIFSCFGCTYSFNKIIQESISEVEEVYFAGENKNSFATFSAGKRETDFVINGYKTKLISFGVLTFNIKDFKIEEDDVCFYEIIIGGQTFNGLLERNPFNGTYVADIKKFFNDNSDIIAKFKTNKCTLNFNLKNVSASWNVDCYKALKICNKFYQEKLEKLVKDKKFLGEIYVKVLKDDVLSKNKYVWYINYCGRKGEYFSLIIDTENGNILSSKTNFKNS